MDTEAKCASKSACGCEHDQGESKLPRSLLVLVSGLLTGLGLILHWIEAPDWSETAAYAVATLTGGLLVFPAAWRALLKLRLDMNVLMTVAVIGAWAIDEGAEGAAVVFLFALSEWLESLSSDRARNAIRSLMSLAPETALKKDASGSVHEVPAAEVSVEDIILVRSGQRIPLDGKVSAGQSAVNQAPITGESVPVDKSAGDDVFAGTVNGEGSLEIRVTKPASDSTLSRIIRLVEEAEESRAPTQRFVDRFATIYTPVVFVAALITALVFPLLLGGEWHTWIYRALALLVIACPCALVIATPVSIVSGLTALARRGVLVKGGAHLEAIGRLKALAVDKTGTITEGKPRVIEIKTQGNARESEILRLAASIDDHSEHPIARAVVEDAKRRGEQYAVSTNYKAITGKGAQAIVDGRLGFVGNHRFAHDAGLCTPEFENTLSEIESRGLSLAVVGYLPENGNKGEILGVIAIGDALRKDAKAALEKLHASGLERIVMLSGDNQRTVDAIAKQAGLDEAFGDLLPDDKVARIRDLLKTHHNVAMIGDGVNDAPALATATVGIAMGAIGSDTAIETADVALMNDELGKLADAIALGKRTLRIIRFNVGFALVIKAVFIVLTFTGHANLWMAILADTGATLLVIVNSLRLLGATKQN